MKKVQFREAGLFALKAINEGFLILIFFQNEAAPRSILRSKKKFQKIY